MSENFYEIKIAIDRYLYFQSVRKWLQIQVLSQWNKFLEKKLVLLT